MQQSNSYNFLDGLIDHFDVFRFIYTSWFIYKHSFEIRLWVRWKQSNEFHFRNPKSPKRVNTRDFKCIQTNSMFQANWQTISISPLWIHSSLSTLVGTHPSPDPTWSPWSRIMEIKLDPLLIDLGTMLFHVDSICPWNQSDHVSNTMYIWQHRKM